MSEGPNGEAFADARVLLARYRLQAKKHFGQNFLISDRAFRAIVDATVAAEDDWIVEIGAGLGTLTSRLCERAHGGKVIALERDPDMVAVMKAELGHLIDAEILQIEQVDALRYDLHMAARWHGEPDRRLRQPAVPRRRAAHLQGARRPRRRQPDRRDGPARDGRPDCRRARHRRLRGDVGR